MATQALERKPVRDSHRKKFSKSPYAGFFAAKKAKWKSPYAAGAQKIASVAAAKALTKRTTLRKLGADLSEIILAREGLDLRRASVVVKMRFKDGHVLVERVDKRNPEAEKTKSVGVAREFDPREMGLQMVEKMKEAEGGAWSGAELRQQFVLSPQTLHRRRKEHRIIFWRDAQHGFHYPKWQFTPTGALIKGIDKVLDTFKSSDEWRIMRYFLVPRHQLEERSPLDLLRGGEVEKVVAHAKAHGEENSW
jgi:hypothetical protein